MVGAKFDSQADLVTILVVFFVIFYGQANVLLKFI